MISWEEKSKMLLGPEIFFELEVEIEGKRLEPVFKSGEDLVGGINADGGSYLRWLVNLEEEEEEEWDYQIKSYLIIEVTFRMCASKSEVSKSISNESFEVEDMRSSEVSFWIFTFNFRNISLDIFDVHSNLEFFRWMNFGSNESLDAEIVMNSKSQSFNCCPNFQLKK